MERITGDKIHIRFEQAVLADDVEVATIATDNFGGDDFGRWEVEIGFREGLNEAGMSAILISRMRSMSLVRRGSP